MIDDHSSRFRVTVIAVLVLVLSALLPSAIPAAAASSLQLSPSTVGAGSTITVTGFGYAPGAAVVLSATLQVGGAARTIQTTAQTNADGTFAVPFGIPAGTNRGLYTITARDFHNNTASQNFSVRPTVVVVAGRQSTLTVNAGNSFFATGIGFVPGETVVFTAVFPLYNGNAVTVSRSAVADKNGMAGAVFLVTPRRTQQGTFALNVVGQKSNRKGIASINVVHRPVISVVPATVHPGSSTTVSGAGFVPGSVVHVAVTIPRNGATTETLTTPITTNADGAFTIPFNLPSNTQPGTYTISATDDVGGFRALHNITVSLHASITIGPASAFPGGAVTITGADFSSGVAVAVTASFPLSGGGAQPLSRTVQTDAQGKFSLSVPIPAGTAAGSVTVIARGPHTEASAALTVVRLNASMTVTPNPVTPGGTVTITGAGFSAGVPIIVTASVPLYGGGSRALSTTVGTNARGEYSAHLTIPRHAASGLVTITAKGPRGQRSVQLQVGHIASRITVSPASTIPGGTVTISGAGYGAGVHVDISVVVRTRTGATQTLPLSVTSNGSGVFAIALHLPATVTGGTYTVSARSAASGRVRTAQLTVAKLAPSLVAVPTSGAPGTPLTLNGFGFEPGATVALSIHGQRVGTGTANAAGQFSVQVQIPHGLATGTYHVTATSGSGRTASIPLAVNRQISTHFYFASFYTGRGYSEYIALLNPTAVNARVTITYQRTVGAPLVKTIGVNAHSRATEDVNADLGVHVSAGAVVAADVPIVAERVVYHGTDGAVDPGAFAPSTIWYFSNGNTSHGYREYLAIENPNAGPVQVGVTFFPTHSRARTIYRTVGPTSRITVKVNTFVPADAVGVRVTSNGPIVVNRTIFIHHGMTSKTGVRTPHRTWYFAAGPRDGRARNFIAVTNPFARRSFVTLHTYGPFGRPLGSIAGYLKPHGRIGYLINRISHATDAAVVVIASRQVVAEQTTYIGGRNDASTDTFGVPTAAKTWSFAAASTLAAGGQSDVLDLFNPSVLAVPIVVQFMNTSGATVQRTYVVGPLDHQRVDVSSVMPNAQLGIVAASNDPFVALNRNFFDNRYGSMTSTGRYS